MSLKSYEIIETANSVVSSVNTFGSKVKLIINNLNVLKSDLSNIKTNIENNIVADDIITNSTSAIKKITDQIDKAIVSANTASTNAIKNGNLYISDLEDKYNSQYKDEEPLILPRVENNESAVDSQSSTISSDVNTTDTNGSQSVNSNHDTIESV